MKKPKAVRDYLRGLSLKQLFMDSVSHKWTPAQCSRMTGEWRRINKPKRKNVVVAAEEPPGELIDLIGEIFN